MSSTSVSAASGRSTGTGSMTTVAGTGRSLVSRGTEALRSRQPSARRWASRSTATAPFSSPIETTIGYGQSHRRQRDGARLGPAAWAGLAGSPSAHSERVGAKRSSTVAPSGPASGAVRRIGGDLPGLAGAEVALLVADPEEERPAQHDPELLVVVAVLLGDRSRLELDDRERQPLAVDGAGRDPVPDRRGTSARTSSNALTRPARGMSPRPAPAGRRR